MIKNVFVSYFVVAAFIYMTVTAWIQLITVSKRAIRDRTSATTEMLFLFAVFVAINVMSLLGVWFLHHKSSTDDTSKLEEIEEALAYMEILD